MQIRTIDAHVGGQPLRLIVDGAPSTNGRTAPALRDWLQSRRDHVRRGVVLEPRGHRDMTAGLLTLPSSPGAHAGLVFMDAHGYPDLSGHGVMAAAAIAIERGLLTFADAGDPEVRLTFDTPAGGVHVRARVEDRGTSRHVDTVALTNVPAFVHRASHPVRAGGREVRVDIAYGGAFFAIVDTETVGVPLTVPALPVLRRVGVDLLDALNSRETIAHPVFQPAQGVAGVIFTGPPHDPEAHLRNVTITRGGIADRSACAAGTSAVMAVLDAMGLLADEHSFVHEGLSGLLLRGRIVRRTLVGDVPAIVTEIEGSVWITGEHTFLFDDDDPFREGFEI
jgi:trans-L-3-hydroxyproline dehydratase